MSISTLGLLTGKSRSGEEPSARGDGAAASPHPPIRRPALRQVLGSIVALVAIAEFGIMLGFERLVPEELPLALTALLDTALLSLTITGPIWWLLGRPLHRALDSLDVERAQGQRLASEQETLLTLIESAGIVSVADSKGRITRVNDSFCAISGYRRDELFGKNHRVVSSGQHPAEFWREMYRTVLGGKP